jgi:uncharacterized membrane protein YozB (DUF420 family)
MSYASSYVSLIYVFTCAMSLCLVYCYLSRMCLKERTIYDESCTITSQFVHVIDVIIMIPQAHNQTKFPQIACLILLIPDWEPLPASLDQAILVTPYSNIPIGGISNLQGLIHTATSGININTVLYLYIR